VFEEGEGGEDVPEVEFNNTNGIEKKDPSKALCDSDDDMGASLDGDRLNIALLLLLYVLQGIPLGMAASIPMILQNKNVSYKQQAMFSLVYWPFSMKLLWAPIVDAAYITTFGRRKTWLVPVQYLIGVFMFILSMKVDVLLEGESPRVLLLTIIFFALNFLAATQDIAVDGWALTMLKKGNVGYASTCNSVGQTAGYFFGNVVLLAFSSPEFCNKYIRTVPQDVGVVTVAGFLFFCSVTFFITTTLLWLFKHESDSQDNEQHGVISTYLMLIKIAKLPAIREVVLILITVRIGFAAADAVTGLKLIEAGVKKETLALMAVPLVPLQILLPLLISKFTTGNYMLIYFMKRWH
jgi:PAT family acetyl-CoA transporter-like MFS transporter 1